MAAVTLSKSTELQTEERALRASRSCSDFKAEIDQIVCKICKEAFQTARDHNRHTCGVTPFKPITPSPSPALSTQSSEIGCLEFLRGKPGKVVLTVPPADPSQIREC